MVIPLAAAATEGRIVVRAAACCKHDPQQPQTWLACPTDSSLRAHCAICLAPSDTNAHPKIDQRRRFLAGISAGSAPIIR